MARKVKEEVSNSVETVVEAVTKQTEEPKVELTHIAMSTCKNPQTGEWCVAEIRYSPSGQVGELKLVPAGPSRDFAIELFKINAFKMEIVG